MSEYFGIVRYKKLTSVTAQNALSAIKDCIQNVDGYWELENSSPTELALRPTVQNLSSLQDNAPGNPNNQRIAIRIIDNYLEYAYLPDGWGGASANNFSLINSTNVSNLITFRNGGNKINELTLSKTTYNTVWVVQYRDGYPYPASSLTILIGDRNTGTFEIGMQTGRIISTYNSSDFDQKIFGDCMLIGSIKSSSNTESDGTAPKWLSSTTATSVASHRPGAWSAFALENLDQFVDDLPLMSSSMISISSIPVGILKYIRHSNVTNPTNTIYSRTANSSQSWKYLGSYSSNIKRYILWGDEREVT